jgi:hypothetical protein
MLKNITFLLVISVSFCTCTKDNDEFSEFIPGIYYGVKVVHYCPTNYDFVDTITVRFDSIRYIYSGSNILNHPPDLGRGNYLIKSNSIEFNDDEARNALYSWEWILIGTHKFRIIGDSLILNQNGSYFQVSCRLIKIAK